MWTTCLLMLKATWTGLAHFFKTPLGKFVVGVVAVGLLVWGLYNLGMSEGIRITKAQYAADEAYAKSRIVAKEAKASKISADISAKVEKAEIKIEWRTKYLTKEVPVYVTAQADSRCVVPVGFVRLYNAAAQGDDSGLPATPDEDRDADSGVALSAVSEADIYNLGVAHTLAERVRAWEEWYVQQETASRAP